MFIKQHNVSEAQAAIGAPPFNVLINQLQICVPVYKHTYAHTHTHLLNKGIPQ